MVSSEYKVVLDFVIVHSKDGSSDNGGRVSVEGIERYRGNSTTNSRSNSLARVTNKIGNLEKFCGVFLFFLVNFKVPVVSELQGESSMIGSFHNDNISHKVRSQQHGKGFDDVRSLWLVTRKRDNSEVLVRTKHNQFRSKDNSRSLFLVVIDLNSRVVWGSEGNHSSLVSLGSSKFSNLFLCKQVFNNLWQVFLPEFFVGLQEVGLASHSSDFTSLDISDVDTFVLVERNRLSSFDDFNFNRRNVIARSVNHPSVSGKSLLLLFINEGFLGSEQKSFFFSKNEDVLNSSFELFTWLQEETAFSLSNFLLSKLLFSILPWIKNNTVLSVVQGEDWNFSDNFFVDIRNVSFGIFKGDEPFFSGLSNSLE
mmetsp:Transcript_23156/g.32296  ORF Transcript_23156/g.32296 Transcript_23156/m.32296 type:complete len:367 (+) Transcript_23156:716-1816(+)